MTATSKGNTVSMVTVSSCIGSERGGKRGKTTYSVPDLAIDDKGKVKNVKLLLITNLTKPSPGQNVFLRYVRINIESFSSDYTYETAHPKFGYHTAD